MALYTYCLSARKAVALENIEMEGLSEAELSMVKLESVKEVLFQVLLLDDVLSELDSERQNHLLNSIDDIQTIITCTGLDEFIENRFKINKVFQVTEGKVEEKTV